MLYSALNKQCCQIKKKGRKGHLGVGGLADKEQRRERNGYTDVLKKEMGRNIHAHMSTSK